MAKHKFKNKHKRRNASSGGTAVPRALPMPRRRSLRRAPPPDFNTTLASVAGGGGGAILGGFLAGQEIMDPETVALALTVGGAVGAYTMEGNMRVAANGLAAAGAGQLALALMAKREAAKATAEATKAAAAQPAAPPQLPAPSSAPPRQGNAARVFNRYSNTAEQVRNHLAYADDDGDPDAFDDYLD